MFRYSNLRSTSLLEIKNKYPELDIAFKFLDKLTFELKKVSLLESNTNTIIFIDYIDSERYFVNIDVTNNILEKCYDEFFLKIILSQINKEVKINLIWDHTKWFDIFSKSLFIVMKNFSFRKKKKSPNYYFFISALINSSLIYFYDINEYNKYCNHLKKIMKKVSYNSFNKKYKDYFPLSYETFFFSKTEKGNSYCRFYKYFDLDTYLRGKTYITDSLLIKLDKTIQLLILICFLNAKFIRVDNQYNDNSYIRSLINSEKETPEIENENYKECLHFNNLLKTIVK